MTNFFKLTHVHVGKDKIKASFEISIKKLANIPEFNGKPVTLSWKRGKAPLLAAPRVAISRGFPFLKLCTFALNFRGFFY